jgi:hypothetical protein
MFNKSAICTLAPVFLLIVILGCNDNPSPPEAPPAYCHYMPTDVGNKWEYRVTIDSKYNPREEYKLVYEIKSTKPNYEGFPLAYVVTISKDGGSSTELILACGGDDLGLDQCYVERISWAYLMEDEGLLVGVWTQTGLVDDEPLEYVRKVDVTVPAGGFQCRELIRDNQREFKPQEWHEYYAEDVGLVKYENFYKEYKGSEPPELVDWRNEVHELVSFENKHPQPTN